MHAKQAARHAERLRACLALRTQALLSMQTFT